MNNLSSQNIPVLILLFNRPDATKVLMEALQKIQPKQLFIAQDGPRNDTDKIKIQQVRDELKINWDCEVKYLFREKNLGCYVAVTEGISWFFEQVEFGIILEDDCIPNESFFRLCTFTNKEYQNSDKIGLVSGSNFQTITPGIEGDYLFSSHCPLLWGWATWRDKWKLFNNHSGIKKKLLSGEFKISETGGLTKKAIKYYMLGNYWDADWYMVCYYHKLLTIVPRGNCISNIGFIGIHNARPGKYHNLERILIGDNLQAQEVHISNTYNTEMLYFLKKMYIYGIIEKIFFRLKIDKYIKGIIRKISMIIYNKKFHNHL